MSLLNQLFNRGVFAAKCKTCLNLAISRIKLLQNKRDLQLKHMRKEIAQFLQAGQEPIARIRVEHVVREHNIWAAYEILELFCEFVLARIPILESQKECPAELREAVASIIFAAPRCSEVSDLLHIKNLFASKYGKEFAMAASELRPDSSVNRIVKFVPTIIEKLSPSAPSSDVKLKTLKEIALEYSLDWDSSATEAEFKKSHEDLLGGSKQMHHHANTSSGQSSVKSSVSNGPDALPAETDRRYQNLNASRPTGSTNKRMLVTRGVESSNQTSKSLPSPDTKNEISPRSSDVLEKARAAIAAAEHAAAAARAAADLVNVPFGLLKTEGGKSS